MNRSPDISDRPARILIVDDERTNRELLEVMLAPEGFVLQTAANGEEAFAMVAQHPPDLILLDIMMPGMDGYQVTKEVKRRSATKNIAVVIISALYARNAKMLALTAGAEGFLTKPVDRAALCTQVRNLLHLKAYGDFHHKYSQMSESEGGARAAHLIESERLYRSTFDAAQVGIAHTSLDGKWLRVNQHLCNLLGYSREELLSSAVQELMQSEEEEMVGEAESFHDMRSGIRHRHVVDEKRYRRRDGSFVWVKLNMSLHRNAEGQSQHFISVIEDITGRRPPQAA